VGDTAFSPASHYDRVTAAWTRLLGDDLHYGVFTSGDEDLQTATAELSRLMLDRAQISPGVEVLDVGCGTGAPACWLATEHGARVTGITTSEVGVKTARARAGAAGVADRVTFELRDGTDNGFADESFDRVWVLESSHLMRQRDRLVSECARVLRSGGRLALCDIVRMRPLPFDEVRRLREPLTLLRDVWGDARMDPVSEYVELATGCGLEVEETIDLTEATRPTFARWRDNAHRYREEVESSLGQADWQRFVDSCEVLEGFWDDGTLGYALLAAFKP
jgi:cyclopropane fatty-acyl-phospholipid synthase-like methyltransferase